MAVIKKEQREEKLWFLRRPAQFLADVAVLCAAFFLAYLPAINVQLSEFYIDTALTQLPFVVLVQFSSLFLVGAVFSRRGGFVRGVFSGLSAGD